MKDNFFLNLNFNWAIQKFPCLKYKVVNQLHRYFKKRELDENVALILI